MHEEETEVRINLLSAVWSTPRMYHEKNKYERSAMQKKIKYFPRNK